MTVSYNGDTNNLTGEGSPNPVKLTIPNLNQVQDPAVQTALLRIVQFLNNLVAPSSGGGSYASLTGPGETATPAKLAQAGSFEITASAPAGDAFATFFAAVTGSAGTYGSCYLSCDNSAHTGLGVNRIDLAASPITANADIEISSTKGAIYLSTSNNGIYVESTNGINIRATGGSITVQGSTVVLGYLATHLRFFDNFTGTGQQTITGSRGGNAALASLMTALDALGLIINSTTP